MSELCPCCGSMLEVSQSDEGTASFIAVSGPGLKAEVESLREKWKMASFSITALSDQSMKDMDEIRSLREKLAAAEEKVSRFLAAMNADGSTFDFEGALTYLRQDLIPNEEAYSGIQEKLALSESRVKELEEKIKYEADVNAALSKQSQEYWQDRELCAGYNRELEEKLALSEAAGAQLMAALESCIAELLLAPCRDNPKHTFCLKCRAVEIAEKALATDHGKAYLDVVRAAERHRKAVRALGGVKSGNPVMMAQYYRDAEAAYQELICALDGLPGRNGAE